MAGQYKQGLDFWPRSVQLVRDPKLRTPKMKHGYLAIIVYELLLDLLFADKGYYIDYSRKEDVVWTVLEGLMGKHQPTYDTIAECIEGLTACELFSGDLFKREIITSRRAQETYYRATVERKMVNINWEIWMLSGAEMKAISKKSVILEHFLHHRPNDSVNRPNDLQSKVNKSILSSSCKNNLDNDVNSVDNKSKHDELGVDSVDNAVDNLHNPIKYVQAHYQKHMANLLSPTAYQEIIDFLDSGVEDKLICRAIDLSIDANARNWPYARKVLDSCITKGVLTLCDFEVSEANRRSSKASQDGKSANRAGRKQGSNKFQNYESRKWDYENLAALEKERLDKIVGTTAIGAENMAKELMEMRRQKAGGAQ